MTFFPPRMRILKSAWRKPLRTRCLIYAAKPLWQKHNHSVRFREHTNSRTELFPHTKWTARRYLWINTAICVFNEWLDSLPLREPSSVICHYPETLGKSGAARSEPNSIAANARLQQWRWGTEESQLCSSAGRPGQGKSAEEEAVCVRPGILLCGQWK